MDIKVLVSSAAHVHYAEIVCQLIETSAKARGTGIAARKPEYIRAKMAAGNAVVAFDGDLLVGFCYIEVWSHNRYVVYSGLVVHPDYRKSGLAREIKRKVFHLARDKYPEAKVFGITTSLAVMKINTELGYKPVTFSELTQDEAFWTGCKSCPNYDILERNHRKMCLCTAMLAPSKVEEEQMALNLSHLIVENK
jgi:GNAT superfamily N-acetyltransferase